MDIPFGIQGFSVRVIVLHRRTTTNGDERCAQG